MARETFGVEKKVLEDQAKRKLLKKRIIDERKYPIPPLHVVADITEEQISYYFVSPKYAYKFWDEVPEEEWQEYLKRCIEKYPNAEFFDTKEQLLEALEDDLS